MENKKCEIFSGFGDYVRHRVFDELHWEYNQTNYKSALLNGLGGMVGLTIGMLIYNRKQNDQSGPQHFD